jgi:hypothetical protein
VQCHESEHDHLGAAGDRSSSTGNRPIHSWFDMEGPNVPKTLHHERFAGGLLARKLILTGSVNFAQRRPLWTSGFKPGFGLSGPVLQLDRVFLPLFRVCVSSISIQSRPSLTAGYWFWISR